MELKFFFFKIEKIGFRLVTVTVDFVSQFCPWE